MLDFQDPRPVRGFLFSTPAPELPPVPLVFLNMNTCAKLAP